MGARMTDTDDDKAQFKLNLPMDLKAALKENASRSRRSLSAEIIARLYASIDAEVPDPPTAPIQPQLPTGAFDKLLQRLESAIDGSQQLFMEVRDEARRSGGGISQVENYRLEPALRRFMADKKMERADAVRHILAEWLSKKSYMKDLPD